MYYTFEPAEWRHVLDGADAEFNEICSKLYDAIEGDFWDNPDESLEEEDEEFVEFQQTLYQTYIDVLLKLKKEDFFKKLVGRDIFLMFSVTDYEYDRGKLKDMISLLNDNPFRQQYLDWMKTWRK